MAVDALAASPFALLDKRGSIRFVTDVVHEDDALCLALACRALRDALWARFPVRPAGDAHAGKRLRTRDAAAELGAKVTDDGELDLRYYHSKCGPAPSQDPGSLYVSGVRVDRSTGDRAEISAGSGVLHTASADLYAAS